MSGRHGGESPPGQRVIGPLDRWAPEAKLVGLVGFLLVVAVTPPDRPMALASSGAVTLAVAAVSLVEPRALLRRLVLDVPLLVLALTYALAGHGPRTEVAGLSLSTAGLRVGLAVLAKATIGIVAVSAFSATTTVTEVVAGLRRLGVPDWLCDLVGLSARQVGVIGDDLGRLRLAAAVRSGGQGRRRQWGAVAGALGTSFVRATERADRLQVAAQARGGTAAGAIVHGSERVATGTPTMWIGAALPAVAALAARVGL